MHPPLTAATHPLCVDVIEALKRCHKEHPVGRLLGTCNDAKAALDRCFRAEARARPRGGEAQGGGSHLTAVHRQPRYHRAAAPAPHASESADRVRTRRAEASEA